MILKGTVLKVERKTGQGGERSWDYLLLHILDGVEVHVCRLADQWAGPTPIEGEIGVWDVSVSAYKRASNGAADLSIRLLRPVDLTSAAARGE